MRRMRSNWQNIIFVIPVVLVVYGINHFSKHRANSASPGSQREIASSKESRAVHHEQLREIQAKLDEKIDDLEEDEDQPNQDLSAKNGAAVPGAPGALTKGDSRTPASSNLCSSEEYPGEGFVNTKISKQDWDAVMDKFHDAKALLGAWLKDHREQFSEKTYDWMATRVAEAKLQRPPAPEEPDLAWRGIGVPADLHSEIPLIRVGGGFVHWVARNPRRSRFELTRLLAQSWTPCEIKKVDGTSPWTGVLSCVDLASEVDVSKSCGDDTYSEAGWAVSSAIASIASPPGCRIPAFAQATVADCMKKAGVGL